MDRWRLPDDIRPGDKRKAEGLVFSPAGRPVVAIDADSGKNAFVLDALER